MTKSKSQLRVEAVERLENYERRKHKNLARCMLGDRYEDVSFEANRLMLIDLLRDDAHESRGSYEERLYDVPVSDCPYCGCKRVVIHDFSDIYENPHSYRVEHVDEKEAFNAGCFETYYSFDSVEKAVEHANMHDLITDNETCPNGNGTCPDDDGTASNAHESHGDALESVLDGDTDSDKGKGAKDSQDTREKLESDIEDFISVSPITEYSPVDVDYWRVREWLDRQAAITQDETIHDYNIAARESGRILRDEIAELQAERDMYRENLEAESNRTCTLEYDGKWLVCSECGESLQWFGVRTIYKDGTQERALGVDGVRFCPFCGARMVDE